VKIFFLDNIGTQRLRRIEDLGYNVEKHQYICRDVVGVRVKNIIYFFKLRVVGKHDKKNIGKP
jgi:hypothetical protein